MIWEKKNKSSSKGLSDWCVPMTWKQKRPEAGKCFEHCCDRIRGYEMNWEAPKLSFCPSLASLPSFSCVVIIIAIITRQSVNICILPLPLRRKFAL